MVKRLPPSPASRPGGRAIPHAEFALAVDAHNAGRLDEAAARYGAVLAVAPRHAASLSFLGVLRQQQGDLDEGLRLTGAAVRAEPGDAVYRLHYANALQSAGRLADALGHYQHALRVDPTSAEAATNLGCALRALRRLEEAEGWHRRAIAAAPGHALAHLNLGGVLADLGRREEAAQALTTAISLDPRLMAAYHGLAVVRMDQGQPGAARDLLARAWALAPGRADIASAMGTALQMEGQPAAAVEWHRQAATAAPDDAEVQFNLGNALMAQGEAAAAASHFRRALELRPTLFAAATNLSHALAAQAPRAERERLLAGVVAQTGLAAARFSLGVLRLEEGRLAEGWADYAARFEGDLARHGRRLPQPRWDGGDRPGASVLIWREQGVGDELMFASVLADLAAAHPAMRFHYDCEARLLGLFTRSLPPSITVSPAYRAPPPACDFHIALGDVAGLVRPGLAAFTAGFGSDPGGGPGGGPGDGPRLGWLRPDPAKAAGWEERLAALGPGLRLGLCWRSTLQTRDRREAYLTADAVAPLLVRPGVLAINLQARLTGEELAAFGRRPGAALHGWPDLDIMADLDGLAALISRLDVVVTPATSVGEMAASLGVPTWRLAPGPDWTHLGTAARPWYPAMRVFMPPPGQPFTRVVGAVLAALGARASGGARA